GWKRKNTTKSL
ncbi:hypothetical protein D046_2070B, partial [Vibrio parahaemolyticus V-223/04]